MVIVMNTYALIENGTVVNMIVWDGNAKTWQPPTGQEVVQSANGAAIGGTYANGVFTPSVAASK